MAALPDSEPLLTLLALHEAGSESAAAELLGIGQSSVSRRISTLQRLSTEPLTTRTVTGTKLTPAGERLLPHARAARAALMAAGRNLAGAAVTYLRVGVDPELTARYAGRLAALHETGAELTLEEGWSRALVEDVRAGHLDAAVVLWAPAGSEPGLTSVALAEEEVVLVAAAGVRLVRGGEPDGAVIKAHPLLVASERSEVSGRAITELRAAGIEAEALVTVGSPAAVRAGVASGAGIGVGLASAFEAEVTAGWFSAVPLGDPGVLTPRLVVSDALPLAAANAVRGALGVPAVEATAVDIEGTAEPA